jgi:hypothetical protein
VDSLQLVRIVAFTSTLTVKDSTIEGNTGVGGGGGVDTNSATTATIVQSTLVDNTAPTGAQLYNGHVMTLASDILATTSGARPAAQCAGAAPTTDGHDIADDASCTLLDELKSDMGPARSRHGRDQLGEAGAAR